MLNKIINRLHSRKTSLAEKESGAALIFAILLLMLMLGVSIFVATTATTQSGAAKEQQLRETYIAAANDGIDYVIGKANTSTTFLESIRGEAKAYTSTAIAGEYATEDVKWRVYSQQVASTGNDLAYYIYATGYNAMGISKGITLRATIESTKASSGTYLTESGNTTISYGVSKDDAWGYGILGTEGITFSGTAKLYSYESGSKGYNPTGTSSAGVAASTNKSVTLANTTSGLKTVVTGLPGVNQGCTPVSNCAGVETSYRNTNIDIEKIATAVNAECPNTTYPIWRASENGGNMNYASAEEQCWGGMIFDQNTTIAAQHTPRVPLKMYVKGNVEVKSGVTVNGSGSPVRLHILSTGATLTMNGTKANFLYAAAQTGGGATTCNINSGIYFGGLACDRINLTGASKLYYDLTAKSVSTTDGSIWSKLFVEEL